MIEDFLWNLDDFTNEEDWGWWLSVGGSPADQDKITAARMMMDEEAMLSKLPILLAKSQYNMDGFNIWKWLLFVSI